MSITVAIVTARKNEHTSYDKWMLIKNAYFGGNDKWSNGDIELILNENGRPIKQLSGEFGYLLSVALRNNDIINHTDYQLRLLDIQTVKPDKVIIVNRCLTDDIIDGIETEYSFDVDYIVPKISKKELESNNLSCMFSQNHLVRNNLIPYGCSDKNTAIIACETDNLIILDDCCLPTPGLVEATAKTCERGNILLIGHRKIHLPTENNSKIFHSESNWGTVDGRNVFGIFGIPLKYIIEVNGFNEQLDGNTGNLDVELKKRMDIYAKSNGIRYEISNFAKVYEIEHVNPWENERNNTYNYCNLHNLIDYKAFGINIKKIRDDYLLKNKLVEIEEDSDGEN